MIFTCRFQDPKIYKNANNQPFPYQSTMCQNGKLKSGRHVGMRQTVTSGEQGDRCIEMRKRDVSFILGFKWHRRRNKRRPAAGRCGEQRSPRELSARPAMGHRDMCAKKWTTWSGRGAPAGHVCQRVDHMVRKRGGGIS